MGAIPERPHNSYSKGPLDIGKSVEISMVLFNVLDWLLKYIYLLESGKISFGLLKGIFLWTDCPDKIEIPLVLVKYKCI